MATMLRTAPTAEAPSGGVRTTSVPKGLPRLTTSICPVEGCARLIRARLFAEDGQVFMDKTCPEHGYVKDVYWSDAALYLKAERWEFGDGHGVEQPAEAATTCPQDCGLCSRHTSHTVLGNIDLTNRCNLSCPYCFANANASGRLCEPGLDEVMAMLRRYRAERPVATTAVQFSGGEPTLHPAFFAIVAGAKAMGFSHIQAASNGLRFAEAGFAARAADAGLHTIYLQFDGIDDRVYRQTRGRDLLAIKLKAIEAIRRAGLKVVYVPTIARGVNDDQVGKILQFALENLDVSSGISYQPVALTGRITAADVRRLRYTLPDLARDIETQTGLLRMTDWYPGSIAAPLSRLIGALRGAEVACMTCHPHCSLATYLYVDTRTGATAPVTRFVDLEGLFTAMQSQASRTGTSLIRRLAQIEAFVRLQRYYDRRAAPGGMDFAAFLRSLEGILDKGIGRARGGAGPFRALLVAGMHFMDAYNYDVERVRRCVIHYSTPDGRIIPFCAYNSGLMHRHAVERGYSVPISAAVDEPTPGPGARRGTAPACGVPLP
jgi:7,8-dihydro-6-hydroxymethylpterin dimethyltransferase